MVQFSCSLCVSHCVSCLVVVAEPQGRAGYPPVAPKPVLRMATGGVGPEEAGQGAVVMKKMVPVQSRQQPAASAAMAQQGEKQHKHIFLGFVRKVLINTSIFSSSSSFYAASDD